MANRTEWARLFGVVNSKKENNDMKVKLVTSLLAIKKDGNDEKLNEGDIVEMTRGLSCLATKGRIVSLHNDYLIFDASTSCNSDIREVFYSNINTIAKRSL